MQEGNRQKKDTISCGCGCFSCLVAVVSFILLCYIGGCDWAKGVVFRCVSEVGQAWHSSEKR